MVGSEILGPLLNKITTHTIPLGKSKIGPRMVILILANVDNVTYFRYLTFYDGILLSDLYFLRNYFPFRLNDLLFKHSSEYGNS